MKIKEAITVIGWIIERELSRELLNAKRINALAQLQAGYYGWYLENEK